MKKVTKILATVLALVLIIGTIPVSAASSSLSLKKTSKILYLGGCKGTKANGTKAKFYDYLTAKKVVNNFDSKKMDIKLSINDEKSPKGDDVVSLSNSTGKITAKAKGTAYVLITVRDKSTEKTLMSKSIKITVKKNADNSFSVAGLEDGGEYVTGKRITVTMSRDKDTDCRKLECESGDVTITKKNSYGSKYYVTFTKAGTYTIKASTYQSSTYKGITATKNITVTVKDAEAPTPTPTPTQAVKSFTVKQTALDTIVLSGIEKPSEIKTNNVEIYTMLGDVKIPKSGIKEVKADGNDVVVKMFSAFEADTVVFVNYTGNTGDPANFTSVTSKMTDVESIIVSKNKVLTGEDADLGIRLLNKDGVDITDGVTGLTLSINMVQGGVGDAYTIGTLVHFMEANKTCVFEIVAEGYTSDLTPIRKSAKVSVTSYEPQATNYIFTVKEETGAYLKKDDKLETAFTIDATNPVIEMLFVYKDEAGNITYKTLAEEGITKVDSADPMITFVGTQSISGGYYLLPNNTGKTTILFYKGDKVVANAQVTILAAKEVSTISVVPSKSYLNVNTLVGDSLELKAVVKDQYGTELKGQTITITQQDGSIQTTGTISFGAFNSEGKLTVPGSSVILKSGVKTGIIRATVTCGKVTTEVAFQVADVIDATRHELASNPEASVIQMDTAIKQGDAFPSMVKIAVEGKNGVYTVSKETIKFYPGKQPNSQIKASDLGVAAGDKVYIYTVQKDGKYLDALPDLVTDSTNELIFKSFDYQKKLEKGTYTISAFEVVAGADNSKIYSVGQRAIQVTNNTPVVQYKKLKDKTDYTAPIDIVKDCFEFYIDGKKVDSSAIVDAEVNISDKGTKYVKSVKIQYTNTVYGNYIQSVTISDSNLVY